MRFRKLFCAFPLAVLAACGGGGGGPDPVENQSPTADGQSVETSEDLGVDVTLTGSDSDGSVASYAITNDPENGTLEGTAPDLSYVPNADFNGSDSFQFTVTDNEGATSSAATVLITIHSINDVPTAYDLSVLTSEETAITISLFGTDSDGEISYYHLKSQPRHGHVTGAGPDVEYVPYYEFAGDDSFEYRVEDDGNDLSGWALVTITVVELNDPPIFPDRFIRPLKNETRAHGLWARDPEGDSVTFEITEQMSNGAARIEEDVLVHIQPDENFVGEDQFKLIAQDSYGTKSREATVTVTFIDRSEGRERELLGSIYDDTNGDVSWNNTTNWKSVDQPIDLWYGLEEWGSRRPGYVSAMDLESNGLDGELNAYWAELGAGQHFRLGENSLTGELPGHFGGVGSVITLDFSGNELTGALSGAFVRNSSLVLLDVGDNQMTGEIPHALVGLRKLDVLRLGGNEFSGFLIPELLPPKITTLDLSDNQFDGAVPATISKSTQLTHLYLEDSGLTGRLPASLMNLENLVEFRYSGSTGNLCAPGYADFQTWLDTIPLVDRATCEAPPTLAVERKYYVHNVTTGVTSNASKMAIWNNGNSNLEVTVTTSDSWLTVSQESFSVDPFRSVDLSVSVDCAGASRRIGTVTISTNDPDRPEYVVHVDVLCLDRDLAVSFTSTPDGDGGGPDELLFVSSLSIEMTSTTEDDYPEPYELEVSVPSTGFLALSLDDSDQAGLIYPGEPITNFFTGQCLREGSVTSTATVTIGTLSASADFTLTCDPDKTRVQELTWYQGPWGAEQIITYETGAVDEGTKLVVFNTFTEPEPELGDDPLKSTPLLENRSSVLRILFAHAYEERRDVLLRAEWEDNSPNSNVALEEVEDHELVQIDDDDSYWSWGTEYFFLLTADQVTPKDEATLILQVEGQETAYRALLLEMNFSIVSPFKPVFIPYVSSGGAGNPAPDWDDDDLLRDTYDWMPLAEVEADRYGTQWFNPNSGVNIFDVLDAVTREWNRVGDDDEFFHGLLLYGWNGYGCPGGAIGVAYLRDQTGASCVAFSSSGGVLGGRDTVAHELGHNWSLHHIECGHPADNGLDPNFPHGRAIGPERMWSYEHSRFVNEDSLASRRDFMSYCSPQFTTDFSYRRAGDYFVRQSAIWAENSETSDDQGGVPNGGGEQEDGVPQSVALILRVDLESSGWTVIQSEYSFKSPRKGEDGAHELVIYDTDGVESHRKSVLLRERLILGSDGKHLDDRARTAIVRVPIPAYGIGSIKVLDSFGLEVFSTDLDMSDVK